MIKGVGGKDGLVFMVNGQNLWRGVDGVLAIEATFPEDIRDFSWVGRGVAFVETEGAIVWQRSWDRDTKKATWTRMAVEVDYPDGTIPEPPAEMIYGD